MQNNTLFEKLGKKGTDFLGSKYPIIGGAMASISTHELVSALANAGVMPFLAAGFGNPEQLKDEIQKTKQLTQNPFGVNVIVIHPQLNELVEVCIAEKISHVTLAAGAPPADIITKLKDAGIKILAFAPTLMLARRLIKMGVDALIVEGTESGGHIGSVATTVLMQEIIPNVDVPVFVAGGIGTGRMIATALLFGAAGCQIGTTFCALAETPVHENWKKAYYRATARNAVQTVQMSDTFPIIPVRSLQNKAHQDFRNFQRQVIADYEAGNIELEDARLKIEGFWTGGLRRAIMDGDTETGSVMAGQIVGLVDEEKTADQCVSELVTEAEKTLQEMKEKLE